jgi:hypothetical protein
MFARKEKSSDQKKKNFGKKVNNSVASLNNSLKLLNRSVSTSNVGVTQRQPYGLRYLEIASEVQKTNLSLSKTNLPTSQFKTLS